MEFPPEAVRHDLVGVAVNLPPDRFANYPSHAEALKAFEAEKPIRVLFESGAKGGAGAPEGVFEAFISKRPAVFR